MVVSGPAPLASRGSWLAIKGQGAEVLAARCNVESKQASRQAGKQAGVQVGAGAPPKVPDVTLQPEQGGAHHRDSRPSPRPRWKSLEVAATGPFEGGEVWLGQWATSGGEAPRSLAGPSALRRRLGPSSHASSRLPHASLMPPSCLIAPKIPPRRLLQSAVQSHVPEEPVRGSTDGPFLCLQTLQTLHAPHTPPHTSGLFFSSGLDPQTSRPREGRARKMP
jgi:hypothetical protein